MQKHDDDDDEEKTWTCMGYTYINTAWITLSTYSCPMLNCAKNTLEKYGLTFFVVAAKTAFIQVSNKFIVFGFPPTGRAVG